MFELRLNVFLGCSVTVKANHPALKDYRAIIVGILPNGNLKVRGSFVHRGETKYVYEVTTPDCIILGEPIASEAPINEQKVCRLVRQLEQLVKELEQVAKDGTHTENENYSRRGVNAARLCGNGQGQAYLAHRIAGKLTLILEG